MFYSIRERGAKITGKDSLSPAEIQKIALENGFKLKLQANGDMDLQPYVYTFVRALIRKLKGTDNL